MKKRYGFVCNEEGEREQVGRVLRLEKRTQLLREMYAAVNGSWFLVVLQVGSGVSVNSVCWAPHEFGLVLGCASADGTVTILKVHREPKLSHTNSRGQIVKSVCVMSVDSWF